MKTKKTAFLFIAVVGAILYESCIRITPIAPDCDPNHNPYFFRLTLGAISNAELPKTKYNYNSPGTSPITIENPSIENFVWQVGFNSEFYCKNTIQLPSLFPTASAIRLVSMAICKEKVDDIEVFTLEDYDTAHLAGSKINDILAISWLNTMQVAHKMNLTEYLTFVNRPVESTLFNLYLNSPPATSRLVKIKVAIRLSNGQRFELLSQAIKIYHS